MLQSETWCDKGVVKAGNMSRKEKGKEGRYDLEFVPLASKGKVALLVSVYDLFTSLSVHEFEVTM